MMKNILIIIAIPLLFISYSFAQSGPYISLEGGLAMPLGKFAGNSDILQDGYAKAGLDGAAGLGYRISENFALGAKLIYTHNKLDGPENIFPNITPWKSTAIMGNAILSYPLSDAFFLEGEVNLGYWMAQFPAANITGGNREAETGSGFGYGAGVGAKYMLAEDFGFKLGINYLGSNPSYEGLILTFDQKIDILTLNWGIIFQL